MLEKTETGLQGAALKTAEVENITRHLSELALSSASQLAIAIQKARLDTYRYQEITFAELDSMSNDVAKGLLALGVASGDRTVLMVKPSVEFFVLSFALMKIGAVTVMIDPGMGIKKLKSCIDEVDASVFIGSLKAHLARVMLSWGKASLKHFVCVAPRLIAQCFGAVDYAQLLKLGQSKMNQDSQDKKLALYNYQTTDLAAILFTSGSTGLPKGVEYTHAMFAAQIKALREHYHVQSGERDLATFPSFALFGPALGIASIIPDMDASKPITANPKHIIDAVARYQCTNMFVSPALIEKLGNYAAQSPAGQQLLSLKRVISAGAPARHEAIKKFRQLLRDDCQLYPSYGATESLPVATIESRELLATQSLTDTGHGVCVGYPVAGMEIDIISVSDEPIKQWDNRLRCSKNGIGEIVVTGEVVSRHYFRRPKADSFSKIDVDGRAFYHRMGDLGYFDDTGRLWMCGRKQHRVQTAQGTLYSIPCERIFDTHALVKRTALVGVRLPGQAMQTAVICIEPYTKLSKTNQQQVIRELSLLAKEQVITQSIELFLFHPGFPVDVRHNAKIVREQLAVWAEQTLNLQGS